MKEGFIDERIRLILQDLRVGSEEYNKELAYIEGLIDGLERFGRKHTSDDVADTWAALAYHVCVREGIAAYDRLRAVVEDTEGALTSYRIDFYKHDFQALRRHKDKSFVWMLRDLGTHMHFTEDMKETNDWVKAFYSTWGSSVMFFGYYDAETKTLHKLDPAKFKGDIQEMIDEVLTAPLS
jgi:hypothetical protein